MKKHLRFVPAAVISVVIAAAISYMMYLVGPGLTNIAEANGLANWGLASQVEGLNSSFLGSILYLLGDLSEGNFMVDVLGSAFMLLGGFLAVYLQRVKSPLGGTGAMNKTWIYLVTAQLLAMWLGAFVWKNVWPDQWLCSFTPSVAITPLAILCFGKPNWKKLVTGVILGAAIVVPLAQLWMINIQTPMGWPLFSGCLGIVMPICSVIGYEIMNLMPWMHEDTEDLCEEFLEENPGEIAPKQSASHLALQRIWGGDSSELYFWGSNVSWIFLAIGWFIGYLINPANSAFSIYAFFITIFTSAVGMVVWGPYYEEKGYAFTCGGILVSCALLGFCGTNVVLALVIAAIGAIVSPAICAWAGNQKFFQRYAACVYLQFGTAVLGMIIFYVCKLTGLFA